MSSLIRRAALVALPVLLISAAPAAAERYVALGDCTRRERDTRDYSSTRAASAVRLRLSEADRHVQRPNTELMFAACSGAKTGNVLSTQARP